MYILYRKESYIIREPLTKNRTCQSWRGKQVAMCERRKPLQDFIDSQKDKGRYYIEKQPDR